MLQRGAVKARDPFYTPILDTVGPSSPSLPIVVVLRRVFKTDRLLIFHTGRYAAKADQIRASPR